MEYLIKTPFKGMTEIGKCQKLFTPDPNNIANLIFDKGGLPIKKKRH
jgi:hypothetical protein